MARKTAFALIALWVVSLIGAAFEVLPPMAELFGIVLGALGLVLLWVERSRRSGTQDE